MTAKRLKAQKYILSIVDDMDTSGINTKIYIDLFKRLSDKEFHEMMLNFKNKVYYISLFIPTGSKVKVDYENVVKIMGKMGIPYLDYLTHSKNGMDIKSPVASQILLLPKRTVKQSVEKGLSVGENSMTRNALTGTVAGKSAASKLSFEEIKIMSGLGLDKTIDELSKIRGGDIGAEEAMEKMIRMGNTPDIATIKQYQTGVQSTKTLRWMLMGAHIEPIE